MLRDAINPDGAHPRPIDTLRESGQNPFATFGLGKHCTVDWFTAPTTREALNDNELGGLCFASQYPRERLSHILIVYCTSFFVMHEPAIPAKRRKAEYRLQDHARMANFADFADQYE